MAANTRRGRRDLLQRRQEIFDTFDRESRGDPYGWDWPTMRVLFPELVAELQDVQEQIGKWDERGKK